MRSTHKLEPISWRADEHGPSGPEADAAARPRRRRRAALAALAGLVVVGSGFVAGSFALAAWLSQGSGSGAARSATSADSAISAEAYVADLFPGAHSTVAVRVTNPNDFPVVVRSFAAGAAVVTAGGCPAGTVTTDARIDTPTGLFQRDGTTVVIPARGFGAYTLDTHMGVAPPDSCQSQTFTIPLTGSLASAAGRTP